MLRFFVYLYVFLRVGIKFVILEGLCNLLKICKGNVRFRFIYIYDF